MPLRPAACAVLTDDPSRVAAVLDVETVMCPIDGAASVEAAVDRDRPRFVLVSRSSAACGASSTR